MNYVYHHDVLSGQSDVRPMSADEQAIIDSSIAQVQAETAAREAQEAARQSAISKLAALGLTVDEISAAFGLENN